MSLKVCIKMCGMLFEGNTWHLQFSDRLEIRVNR